MDRVLTRALLLGLLLALAVAVAPGVSAEDAIAADTGYVTHVVQSGDTLFSLARRYGAEVSEVMQLNDLDDPRSLVIGQVLRFPESQDQEPAAAPPLPRNKAATLAEIDIGVEAVDLLGRLIQAEAGSESFAGKVGVGAVVVNRLLSPDFPGTLKEVIFQPGQFLGVNGGRFDKPPGPEAVDAANLAFQGIDPTAGALFFYNPERSTALDFWKTRVPTVQIGKHVFTR